MSLGERILTFFSRDPGADDYSDAVDHSTIESALEGLRRSFPDLDTLVAGAAVADFGCGTGRQAVALARAGAANVIGVDNNLRTLAVARELALQQGVGDRVTFVPELGVMFSDALDIIISQNAFEHFDDPEAILATMTKTLRPGGRILIAFGPPWYAPTGSHMHFFTRLPWVNLLFAEKTVMRVRARYRSDGAMRYEDVESGLNRMTVGKFERIVRSCGLIAERREYTCIKGIRVLQYLPVFRELFINNVACVLRRPDTTASGSSLRAAAVTTA